MTPRCAERAAELYGTVCDQIVQVTTPEAAEMTKLLENIFRSVNIALVNELAILSERMGIDIWEVVDAAATKPYGFMGFEPGPGMGGHCLPVDPFYLTWRAREFHMSTEFIELAGKINQQMPIHCVERIERALNDAAKPVRGSRIMIVGVAYKGGVGDLRESPALRIMEVLAERGGQLSYHDPYVPSMPEFGLESVPLEGAAAEADAVVLVTAHPGIDHSKLAAGTALFVDLRGVTRGQPAPHVVRL
jgi:UDP-N-acetyl-D-glucosamine dehydrogenase